MAMHDAFFKNRHSVARERKLQVIGEHLAKPGTAGLWELRNKHKPKFF